MRPTASSSLHGSARPSDAASGCESEAAPRPARTALMLALLLLDGWILWAAVLINANDALAIVLPLIGVAVAPILARFAATASPTRPEM